MTQQKEKVENLKIIDFVFDCGRGQEFDKNQAAIVHFWGSVYSCVNNQEFDNKIAVNHQDSYFKI